MCVRAHTQAQKRNNQCCEILLRQVNVGGKSNSRFRSKNSISYLGDRGLGEILRKEGRDQLLKKLLKYEKLGSYIDNFQGVVTINQMYGHTLVL